jgi:hypothetical protein
MACIVLTKRDRNSVHHPEGILPLEGCICLQAYWGKDHIDCVPKKSERHGDGLVSALQMVVQKSIQRICKTVGILFIQR